MVALTHSSCYRRRIRCLTSSATEGSTSHGREATKQARTGGSAPGPVSASRSGRQVPFTRRVLRSHGLSPQARNQVAARSYAPPRVGRGSPARVYSSVVVGALRVCADASGWLCGKRLAPFLAELVPALEVEGALRLEPLVRSQLLAMSAATIDRRLQPFRLQFVRGFGASKPGSLIKSQVPVRTWTLGRAAHRIPGD